jgi:hypothetical protein
MAARFAPRCFVVVIFGDGSYLVARYSRLEPAREEIAIDGNAGRCELTADLGGLRIYRYVRVTDPTIAACRMGSGMIQ